MADGVFYTAQVPIRPDGSIETGPARDQVDPTLRNLGQAIEAAGGTMDDVTQASSIRGRPNTRRRPTRCGHAISRPPIPIARPSS